MKYFEWDAEKNLQLKAERDVGFEDVIITINEGKLLDILAHPNKKKYANQQIFVIDLDHYVYLVPFVENEQSIFLKTVIPSRKATKDYLIKEF